MKALVCIHGFGGLRIKDFDYLRDQCREDGLPYFDFNMYDQTECPDWRLWVKRAYREVQSVCEQGYEVTLLGFSMGGVIAGYLASRLPVQRVVLVAPAYFYLGIDSSCRYLKKLGRMGAKDAREMNAFIQARWLSAQYVFEFIKLTGVLRQAVKEIDKPVLLIQASKDDIVPPYASRYAMRKIPHQNKQCCMIEGGNHEILNDKRLGREAYLQIAAFMGESAMLYNQRDIS
ncbi:alpha/beta fold hydrolase [Clostridiaceae bacterium DONG20-135]|uniref:Alpha/beta fold hydrolase n=1 Tax=Copranaerobaculum intestinale TaxID=2692629 RepID=A0A6N8U5P1_9FIRM|nr:alpha/beta fold hydrolase [Copranaerobaculum intestinale]MXQ73518.1 alpha/beta fold hydrolase [Copranaerobaculum intestinale]